MSLEPFTVEHKGQTFTVTPVGPNVFGVEWVSLNRDDPWTMVCVEHRRVFDTHDTSRCVQKGHGASTMNFSESCGCADCCWEAWRNPTQAEVGLEELPAWWVRSTYGEPRIECLFCREHARHFNLDECCRKCVDIDEDAADDA